MSSVASTRLGIVMDERVLMLSESMVRIGEDDEKAYFANTMLLSEWIGVLEGKMYDFCK